MEIAFESIFLRQICEDEKEAQKKYGLKVASKLKARLLDIRAANSIDDLIVGLPEILGNQYLKIELAEQVRLILCANHVKNPLDINCSIDWEKVSRVKVINIEKIDGKIN